MQTQTEGLIIKSRDINENDTVVKILTGDLGLISAFANGTKKVKSRTASAAVSPMTYSRLTLYRGRESYIVDDAKAIDVFFGLREDIEKLSLANYFCELAGEFSPENTEAHEFLSLTLNLLHLLSEDKRSADFLKPVGELRMLALAGYMPDHSRTGQEPAPLAPPQPESSLKILGDITERYLLLQLGHKLRTLDFYKSIKM